MFRNTSSINRHIYWLLGILLLVLTSCDYTFTGNRIGDGGLLSGKPCFWEICPGVTTKDQAIEILREKGAINDYQTNNLVSFENVLSFEYDPNGIVSRVDFMPNTTITVESLIAKYGFPDGVVVIYDESSRPDYNTFRAGLFYDNQHIYIELVKMHNIWPPIYQLNPGTQITNVTYFAEKYYKTWKASSTHHISKWNGYGAYEDSP